MMLMIMSVLSNRKKKKGRAPAEAIAAEQVAAQFAPAAAEAEVAPAIQKYVVGFAYNPGRP